MGEERVMSEDLKDSGGGVREVRCALVEPKTKDYI